MRPAALRFNGCDSVVVVVVLLRACLVLLQLSQRNPDPEPNDIWAPPWSTLPLFESMNLVGTFRSSQTAGCALASDVVRIATALLDVRCFPAFQLTIHDSFG